MSGLQDGLYIIQRDVYIAGKIAFYPSELRLDRDDQSSHRLDRADYIHRDEAVLHLQRLVTLYQAMTRYHPMPQVVITSRLDGSSLRPRRINYTTDCTAVGCRSGNDTMIIPTSTHQGWILPGRVQDGVYIGSPILEVITALLDRHTYIPSRPHLDLPETASAEVVTTSLIKHLRDVVKWYLVYQPERSHLYADTGHDILPLERAIQSRPNDVMAELILRFSAITSTCCVYVDESRLSLGSSSLLGDGDIQMVHPTVGSSEKTDVYTIPIHVSFQALHPNYAYTLDETASPPVYEDFIGQADWIIAPIRIYRSDDGLRGCPLGLVDCDGV